MPIMQDTVRACPVHGLSIGIPVYVGAADHRCGRVDCGSRLLTVKVNYVMPEAT